MRSGGKPEKPVLKVRSREEIQKERIAETEASIKKTEKTLKEVSMKVDSIFAVSPVAFPEIQRRMCGPAIPTAEYESALPAGGGNAPEYRLAPITVSQRVHVIYLISSAK